MNNKIEVPKNIGDVDRFMSMEELMAMSPDERKAFITFFHQYSSTMNNFFVPFEEEQLLIDSVKFEKKHSEELGDVVVIAGPSGVGKDTAIKRLLEEHPEILKVVSATTREPRSGEKMGLDYHYLDRETFLMLLEARMLIHRAEYAGKLYGVPKVELRKRIGSRAVLFNVIGEGVKVLKRLIPETKTIIIMPPSIEDQLKRLKRRSTENDEQILKRVEADKILFKDPKDNFDYIVISEDGDVKGVVEQISEIIKK